MGKVLQGKYLNAEDCLNFCVEKAIDPVLMGYWDITKMQDSDYV
jgi:hypothetical protein